MAPNLADSARTVVGIALTLLLVSTTPAWSAPNDPPLAGKPPAPALQGTAWQLVRFQGGDDTILTPDDKTKYTIEFAAGGRLIARLDCNRGRGTWQVSGSSQLTLGPLALTRARCPDGSLHDRLVKHWPFVRSFVIKEGHLFLALMADGGIYEFEPIAGGTR